MGCFFHVCAVHQFSHFPPLPLPYSFFLSWGNHPASISSVKKAFHLLLNASHSGKTPEFINNLPQDAEGFISAHKKDYLSSTMGSIWVAGGETQTNPLMRRLLLPVKSVLASTGKKRLVSPAVGCLYDCFFPQLCFFELLFLCSVIE